MLTIMFSVYFYQMFFSPNILVKKEATWLYIPEGASVRQVADSLQYRGQMENLMSFMFVAKVLDYPEQVKPGRYALQPNMSNLQVVRLLRSGRQDPVRLTFTHARTLEDLAPRLCRPLAVRADELIRLLQDPAVVEPLGFDTATVRTMFVPNTYEMYWNTTATQLIERMKKEYDRFWTDERKAKASAMGLTPVQVSILASIVEAETQKVDERPRVAGLYLNRLNQNRPLEADPTVVFANGDFSIRRVLRKHLEADSPYNTYRHTGLPPGPINIPSISSIDAVLNHEKHNYLFMCAREDFSGYHNFAVTFAEHQINAVKFRKALNKAGIKE